MEKNIRKKPSLLRNIFKLHWMLVAIFIYSAALAAGNFLIINPQLQQYEYIKKTRSNLDEIYLKLCSIDIQTTHDRLKNESNYVSEIEKSFTSRCVETKNLARVISDLNHHAQDVGLQLLFIDFLPEQEFVRGSLLKKPITMRLLGTYDQIVDFYYQLEKIPYWLLVDSFIITAPKSADSKLNISLVLFTIMTKT